MAQVGRAFATAAATSVPGSRAAAGARNIAAVERAPVEEIQSRIGASLHDGAFLLQDQARHGPPDQEPREEYVPGLVQAPNELFTIFLEDAPEAGSDAKAKESGVGRSTSTSGLLARALRAYGVNSDAGLGGELQRGVSLSVDL